MCAPKIPVVFEKPFQNIRRCVMIQMWCIVSTRIRYLHKTIQQTNLVSCWECQWTCHFIQDVCFITCYRVNAHFLLFKFDTNYRQSFSTWQYPKTVLPRLSSQRRHLKKTLVISKTGNRPKRLRFVRHAHGESRRPWQCRRFLRQCRLDR